MSAAARPSRDELIAALAGIPLEEWRRCVDLFPTVADGLRERFGAQADAVLALWEKAEQAADTAAARTEADREVQRSLKWLRGLGTREWVNVGEWGGCYLRDVARLVRERDAARDEVAELKARGGQAS